jgi:PleD family two-component response regulator
MAKILCKISDEDAKKLTETIVEVEACKELYNEATKHIDCQPIAIKAILDYYMHSLKIHKALWKETLIKYIGEENTAKFYNILRFDTVTKDIFKLEIEGCSLCQK